MSKQEILPDITIAKHPALVKIHLLSMTDIFRDLSREEIQEIEGMLNMLTCKKGHILYRPEEEAETLFLLKRGKVEVYSITVDGKRLVMETIAAGTFFGEMSLTGQSMHQAFAETTEDSMLCVLSKSDLERLLVWKSTVALRVIDSLSRQLQETRTMLEDVTFRSAAARVCRLLLKMARHTSELRGLTHQQLADATGLCRETVTRALHRLQRQGLVELHKKRLIVLNKAGLENIVLE